MAFGNEPLGLENEPDNGGWERWAYGMVAPLPLVWIALLWIISRRANLHDKVQTVLHGTDAAALGLTVLFLAFALHFHFFWRLSEAPKLRQYSFVGTAVSALGLALGMLYMIWCFFRLFLL